MLTLNEVECDFFFSYLSIKKKNDPFFVQLDKAMELLDGGESAPFLEMSLKDERGIGLKAEKMEVGDDISIFPQSQKSLDLMVVASERTEIIYVFQKVNDYLDGSTFRLINKVSKDFSRIVYLLEKYGLSKRQFLGITKIYFLSLN